MPVPFSIPASKAVDPENGLLPSEGWHDATMTGKEARMSKNSGLPMMVAEFTIDNEKFAGAKVPFTFVFGLSTGNGEANLLKFLNADGTFGTSEERWKQLPTLEEFVDQFPADQLRAGIKIIHSYSIKNDSGWENTTKEKWEAFSGKKNLKAEISDFRGAQSPSAIKKMAVDNSTPDGLPFAPSNSQPPF